MTPNNARKEDTETALRANIEMKLIHKRKYPDLAVGDRVYKYKKR